VEVGWFVILATGVVFLLAARPIAGRTVNSYPRLAPGRRARAVPAQTMANRIGGVIAIILGTFGLFKPGFLK